MVQQFETSKWGVLVYFIDPAMTNLSSRTILQTSPFNELLKCRPAFVTIFVSVFELFEQVFKNAQYNQALK